MRIPAGELTPDVGSGGGGGWIILFVVVLMLGAVEDSCDNHRDPQITNVIPTIISPTTSENVEPRTFVERHRDNIELSGTSLECSGALHVITCTIPAQSRFVAKEYFKEDMSESAEIRIRSFDTDFYYYFLELDKIEEQTGETSVDIHLDLATKFRSNQEIFDELGVEKAETTLSQLWAILKTQKDSGLTWIFYIRDARNSFWIVKATWIPGRGWDRNPGPDGGWTVVASSNWHLGCSDCPVVSRH